MHRLGSEDGRPSRPASFNSESKAMRKNLGKAGQGGLIWNLPLADQPYLRFVIVAGILYAIARALQGAFVGWS